MTFSRQKRRRGPCHVEVDALGRQSGPRAAMLRPEGATQQQHAGRGDGGEDLSVVAWIACHARYAPTGRRNGSTRVGAASGTTWRGRPRGGGDRVLQHYDPKGRRSGNARVGE